MRKRAHIPLKTKLAAVVLAWINRPFTTNPLASEPRIDFESATKMTADQIIRLVEFHHWPVAHSEGGPDEAWNLEPILREEHFAKTVEQAKARKRERKLARRLAAHRQAMGAKKRRKRKIPSRPFPAPIQKGR